MITTALILANIIVPKLTDPPGRWTLFDCEPLAGAEVDTALIDFGSRTYTSPNGIHQRRPAQGEAAVRLSKADGSEAYAGHVLMTGTVSLSSDDPRGGYGRVQGEAHFAGFTEPGSFLFEVGHAPRPPHARLISFRLPGDTEAYEALCNVTMDLEEMPQLGPRFQLQAPVEISTPAWGDFTLTELRFELDVSSSDSNGLPRLVAFDLATTDRHAQYLSLENVRGVVFYTEDDRQYIVMQILTMPIADVLFDIDSGDVYLQSASFTVPRHRTWVGRVAP